MHIFEEIFSQELLTKYKTINEKKPEGVANFLVGDDKHVKIYRDEFIKHLECINKLNGLSKQHKSRLCSLKWDEFWQAKAELEVAYFINEYLNYNITFTPEGKGRCSGDIEIIVSGEEKIFVEVKAPYRETPSQIYFGDDTAVIRNNLKKAYSQIPKDRPSIVIIDASLRAGCPDEQLMIKSLYGENITKAVVDSAGEKAEFVNEFNPNGFLKWNINRNISAVGTLCFSIINPIVYYIMKSINTNYIKPPSQYKFHVYHNPYCKMKIKPKVFKKYPQYYVNSNNTEMEWLNKDL